MFITVFIMCMKWIVSDANATEVMIVKYKFQTGSFRRNPPFGSKLYPCSLYGY